jgi:hypothetical protein
MSDPTPPTAQAGSSDDQPPIEEKKFSQAELDTLIKDRLDRQRRAMETQQREAQAALETQKLEDQKEFEKLAKQRAEEINTIKPRAALAESYEKSVSRLMAEASKTLPSNLQMLLNKLPLSDQLDWLTENLDSVRTPPVVSGGTDINAWSRTTNAAPAGLNDEEYKAKKRREMTY